MHDRPYSQKIDRAKKLNTADTEVHRVILCIPLCTLW